MDFNKAKRKWFKKNVTSYQVYFEWYGWSYLIIQYQDGFLIPVTHHSQEIPAPVSLMQQYLWGIEPYELFCEARRLSIEVNNPNERLKVIYNTPKIAESTIRNYLEKGNTND